MKKLLVAALLLLGATAAFAQDDWRNRPAPAGAYPKTYFNTFELTPLLGYRYGGTIYADQTDLYNHDVDIASSAAWGASLAIPLANTGMKAELLFDRQDSHFEEGGGLFEPSGNLANMHVTYYQAGLQVPFAISRSAVPYFVVSAGIANLKPDVEGFTSDNRFAGSAGIGVKIPVNPNIGVKLEARGFWTSTGDNGCGDCYYHDYYYSHDLFQGETSVGLSFHF